MIEVDIQENEFINACREWYRTGQYQNSFVKGGGLVGILGERFVNVHLDAKRKATKDYDLITKDRSTKTIEVKTARTSVVPSDNYSCSIFATSKHQQWDYIYFTRVLNNHKKIFLLGWLNRKDFYEFATFTKRGHQIYDGMLARGDCYSVQIRDLNSPRRKMK